MDNENIYTSEYYSTVKNEPMNFADKQMGTRKDHIADRKTNITSLSSESPISKLSNVSTQCGVTAEVRKVKIDNWGEEGKNGENSRVQVIFSGKWGKCSFQSSYKIGGKK